MHSSSPSQETETEFEAWRAPESPAIVIRRSVMEGIRHEVHQAFAGALHAGDECGGILLGGRTANQITVEDFEPVPSDANSEILEETLAWFRSGAQPGLSVLGFYRSHTPEEFALTEEDEELLRTHFAGGEDLIVLVKTHDTDDGAADVCVRLHGRAARIFLPIPYPLREGAGVPPAMEPAEAALAQPEPPPPLLLAAPAAFSWPPPRSRLLSEPERPKRRWLWYGAFAALGLAGGALGYLWVHPAGGAARQSGQVTRSERAPGAAATTPSAPSAAAPSVPSPLKPTPAPLEAEPATEDSAPNAPDTAAIRALLDRWASALKHGDVAAATACYSRQVSTYFGRHDVTREAVRTRIRQTLARYGGFDLYRVSDVKITAVSDGRAVATLRKSWRTSGRRKSAGEEQERMTLVRTQGYWRISSEQQERIRWVRRPR